MQVKALQVDLSTMEGVDRLYAAAGGRPVDALLGNAGRGLGHAFLDEDFTRAKLVLDTNVTGTLYLLHKVAGEMRARDRGRILITGSIAGFMPGSFQAVYNGTKAFIDSFSFALRNELKDSAVTVTCLMPGPTDTEFFERADVLDTKVGQGKKADPAKVAKMGFEAMLAGDGDVVAGWKNKLQGRWRTSRPRRSLRNSTARWRSPDRAGPECRHMRFHGSRSHVRASFAGGQRPVGLLPPFVLHVLTPRALLQICVGRSANVSSFTSLENFE